MEQTYFTIIPNSSCSAILLQKQIDGWELPSFTFRDRYFWQAVAHINQVVSEQHNVQVTTLNCIQIVDDEVNETTRLYYALENHTPAMVPIFGTFWIPITDVHHHLQGEQLAVFQNWYRFVKTKPIPENRVPWYMPKWTGQAQKWVTEQLTKLGVESTKPMIQIRSWQRASLWRVPTNIGDLYFKAVPLMFRHEPELTEVIASHFPGRAPKVLAHHRSQHWFLMEKVGDQGLNSIDEIDHWETAIRGYAEIQIELANHINDLIIIDTPDRRLQGLPRWIDRLFDDTRALKSSAVGLSDKEISQLLEMKPKLLQACQDLEDFNLPASVEHGDFWSGQILQNGDQFAIIDWSDASVSHPFFSAWFFMAELSLELPNVADAYERLTQAYLESWAFLLTTRQLFEAFKLAQLLGPVHHALIYYRQILPNMEIKWEMEQMLPNALRQLLIN